MLERRSNERFDLQLDMRIRAGEHDLNAITRNVSASGILVDCDSELNRNKLEFVITFPPEITLSTNLEVLCEATVVRVVESSSSHTQLALRIRRYQFLPQREDQRAA
jgi:hypothetical protein